MEHCTVQQSWMWIGAFYSVFLGFAIWNMRERRVIFATECGHLTRIKDYVWAYGQQRNIMLPVENGKTPYCHKCLESMIIRCAWCGKPIFIGSPITLYVADRKTKMPSYAVLHSKEHNTYVGCLRWECADSGADRAGFWYPPGQVHRVPTAIELCMQNMNEGGNGVVIIDDLSKP